MRCLQFIVFTLLIFTSYHLFSQNEKDKVELTDLISDIIKTKKDGENMKQVFWLPKIYWELAIKDSPYGNDNVIEEVNTIIGKYEIFAISDIDFKAFGGIEKNSIQSIRLVIERKEYRAIETIPSDLEALLDTLLPVFKRMLGQYGNSIEVFVFDNSNEYLPSTTEQGQFSILVNDTRFDYRLPLSALVPKKNCPVDNEKLDGAWLFCPWHGKKLN